MGRLIEGFWDCEYCGTKGNRGSIKECPNCGNPRNETTKFYLKQDSVDYVPDEKSKNINRNPDWICMFCDSLNSDNDKVCTSCGASRTNENLNYFENIEVQKKKKEERKKRDDFINEYINNSTKNIEHSTKKSLSFKFPIRFILIILAAILFISGIIYLFIPKEQEILIQELSWQYSINIEKFKTVDENGLSLPAGARLKYTDEELSHYVDVLDHYETKTRQVAKQRLVGYEDYVSGYKDLGNGYFEEIISQRPIYETYYENETYQEGVYRKQPIFRTRYYYEIDKWVHERTVTTSGTTKETYWGDTNLQSKERVASKTESYFVSGLNTKKNKETKIQVSLDDWNSIKIDTKVKFKISLGHGKLVKE